MTATTITLDRACTWGANAGVALPWNDAALDMGAFESGFTGATTTTPSTVTPTTSTSTSTTTFTLPTFGSSGMGNGRNF